MFFKNPRNNSVIHKWCSKIPTLLPQDQIVFVKIAMYYTSHIAVETSFDNIPIYDWNCVVSPSKSLFVLSNFKILIKY